MGTSTRKSYRDVSLEPLGSDLTLVHRTTLTCATLCLDCRTSENVTIVRLQLQHTFSLRFLPKALYYPVIHFESVMKLVKPRRTSRPRQPFPANVPPAGERTNNQQPETFRARRGILKTTSPPRLPASWPFGWNYLGHSHDRTVRFHGFAATEHTPKESQVQTQVLLGSTGDVIWMTFLSEEALKIGAYLYAIARGKPESMANTMSFLADDYNTSTLIRFLSTFYQQPRYDALQQALAHGAASHHRSKLGSIQYPGDCSFEDCVNQMATWCVDHINDMGPQDYHIDKTSGRVISLSSEISIDTHYSSGTYFDWYFTDPLREDTGKPDYPHPRWKIDKTIKDKVISAPTRRRIRHRDGRAEPFDVACDSSREEQLKKVFLFARQSRLARIASLIASLLQGHGAETQPLLDEFREDLEDLRDMARAAESRDTEGTAQPEDEIPATGTNAIPWVIVEQRIIASWEDLVTLYTLRPVAFLVLLTYRVSVTAKAFFIAACMTLWAELIFAFERY